MGFKGSINEKAVAARDRKAEAAAIKNESQRKAKEDAAWNDDNKKVQMAMARKAEATIKQEDRLRRKAENRQLADEEDRLMQDSKQGKAVPKKLTRAEIQLRQLMVAKAGVTADEEKAREQRPETMTELEPNVNHLLREERYNAIIAGEDPVNVASGIDAALVATSGGPDSVDRHPERRAKIAYAAFEKQQIEILRTENPSLKRSQLKDRVWRLWQKSPENPVNQLQ